MYVKFIFCFKKKTAYEMRISDCSSDVCSSDLVSIAALRHVESEAAFKQEQVHGFRLIGEQVQLQVMSDGDRAAYRATRQPRFEDRQLSHQTRRERAQSLQSLGIGGAAEQLQIANDGCVDLRIVRPRRRTSSSEEHTSELQSLMSISYAVFCLKKKSNQRKHNQ